MRRRFTLDDIAADVLSDRPALETLEAVIPGIARLPDSKRTVSLAALLENFGATSVQIDAVRQALDTMG